MQKSIVAAEFSFTGISGILWLPLVLPATKCGKLKTLPVSSVAGNIFCVLIKQTGSSLPTYLPAMLCRRSVDASTIGSPLFVVIEDITYLPGYIKAASSVGLSSHNDNLAIEASSTSIT